MGSPLSLSVADGIGQLIIDRPESANALSRAMWEAVPEALARLAALGAEVVVLRGAGSAFASGADLSELKSLDSRGQAAELWLAIFSALSAVASSPAVTIACIDGPCFGGGCLLAVACDLRYASTRSVFGIPVARLGIVLDDETVARLVALVGPGFARELLLRGHTVDHATASRMGLVNAVFGEAELALEVDRIAGEIRSNSPESIRQSRESIARALQSKPSRCHYDVVSSYLSSDFRSRLAQITQK